jgi:hypothetical protein
VTRGDEDFQVHRRRLLERDGIEETRGSRLGAARALSLAREIGERLPEDLTTTKCTKTNAQSKMVAMTGCTRRRKKRTSEVVGMGGRRRQTAGRAESQENTRQKYTKKKKKETQKTREGNEQIRNRIGESKRCGSHSGRGRIQ